jgi:hypothetical protein
VRHRSRNAPRLRSSASARDLFGFTRKSWLAGPRYGNASRDQRNRHRLVPVCSGARAPFAREDRKLVRVCPRVVFGSQKSASGAKAQRSAYPVATERTGREPGRRGPQGPTSVKRCRQPPSRWQSHGGGAGRSRALERVSRGKGPWPYGRHSGPHIPHARFTRTGGGGLGDPPMTHRVVWRAATGVSEARPHTSPGEENAPGDERTTRRCGPSKRVSWREPGGSPRHGTSESP